MEVKSNESCGWWCRVIICGDGGEVEGMVDGGCEWK